ncbi:MAG: hypothetical protein AABX16_03480, partial [Nanoarchaeota archaeon]
HRFFILILILCALFLYSSFIIISQKNVIDLSTSKGVFAAMGVYGKWLVHSYENVKVLTGKAIEMDWFQDKKTNSNVQNKTSRAKKR